MTIYYKNNSKNTRFILVAIAFVSILIFLRCSGIDPPDTFRLDLNNGWRMNTGDNPAWAEADFDDSTWDTINVGVNWEKAGYTDYNGYAWYRITITIPETFKQSTPSGFLSLLLGYIDDVDVTYFNGEKIGSTGTMPPEYTTAYAKLRKYRIPMALVHWDKANALAVRVYDGDGDGGIYNGPFTIKIPEIDEIIDINFEIGDSDGIYPASEPLAVTVRVTNYSNSSYDMVLISELKPDRVDTTSVIASTETKIHIEANSTGYESLVFHPPLPGFYRVVCTLSHDTEKAVTKSIVLGVDPESIKTKLTREDDFVQFWEKRQQELAHVDPAYKITRSDMSSDDVDVFLVEMCSYGHVTIRGWYTVPKKNPPYPAILSVPGYTATMWPHAHRKNVATFALNPRGHGNSKDDVDPKGAEYMYLGFDLEHPENYIYTGAYMDCIRAIDFLVSRPEVDKSRIGVEGGSQGGGLSFATAALDQRIAFCAPDIPWLGDWTGYLEAAEWPNEHYPELFAIIPGLTFSDINRLLSYFDTMNLADRIKCPVLMSVGLQDSVCPPRTAFATYNRVVSDKSYRVYPSAGHWVEHKHNDLKNKWMAKQLGVEKSGL
jgi:cephalosporin-C deacetylase